MKTLLSRAFEIATFIVLYVFFLRGGGTKAKYEQEIKYMKIIIPYFPRFSPYV